MPERSKDDSKVTVMMMKMFKSIRKSNKVDFKLNSQNIEFLQYSRQVEIFYFNFLINLLPFLPFMN